MEYVCKKNKDFVFKGNREDWANGVKVFLKDTVTGEEPKAKTQFSLLYSNDYLYVMFDCIDDEIFSTFKNFNDHLYDEDVVEVFLSSGYTKLTYEEIEISPKSKVLDYIIENENNDLKSFRPRARDFVDRKITQDGQNWFVEARIPFNEFTFINPKSEDRWLFNAYRIDGQNGDNPEFLALNPTLEKKFHRPNRFIDLKFE